ncbi:MAG: hypothetical protein ABI833_04590 [Acidobacteriota bacterium]
MMEVGKFRSTYVVPSDQPFPRAACERLDSLAARHLPHAISRALAAVGEARGDNSIWIFRSFEFEVDLDLDHDDDALAALWAERLMAAIARHIDEAHDAGIVHFKDAADLLRAYIVDAAFGRPRKWYCRRFEGLDYLSTTARIRTAVCSNPQGIDALLRMMAPELRAVIAALSENDARRIWETLAKTRPEAPITAAPSTLPGPDGAGEFRWALHVSLAAGCWIPAARALGRLLMVIRGLDSSASARAIDCVAQNRPHDLRELMTLEDFVIVEPLLGTPRPVIEPFLDRRPESAEAPERRYTVYGGAFLLLPFLDALPIQDPLLRFLLLLKVLGAPRAMRAFEDSVLRSLFKVDPALSAESFRRWQGAIRVRQLRRLRRLCLTSDLMRDNSRHLAPGDRAWLRLPRPISSSRDNWLDDVALLVARSLAWRLPGFSTASLPYLYENFLEFPASIEEFENHRVIRLGAPPLQLILNMTGLCRWRYTVSWLDPKPFHLYPEAP